MRDSDSLLSRLCAARDRGGEYLARQQRASGLTGEPEWGFAAFYKVLVALARSGHSDAAVRLARWVRRSVFDFETGDFPSGGARDDCLELVYPNAWLTLGAHLAGDYGMAVAGARFLGEQQDRGTGGFVQQTPYGKVQDALSAAVAGLACLVVGEARTARAAATFLHRMWDAQPRSDCFYFVLDAGRLRMDFPDEAARLFLIRPRESGRQWYFVPGAVAAFLAEAAGAYGEPSWLDTAAAVLAFARYEPEVFRTAQVGKLGWGAAAAYRQSGDDGALAVAVRVGEALLDQQQADGCWHNTGGFKSDAETIDVTAEFVFLIDEISRAVALAPSRVPSAVAPR